MKDEWIKKLRDQLADYEEPVPDGLWAEIEARLPKPTEAPKRAVRTIPLWTKWAAAASFIGIITGIGILNWSQEEKPSTPFTAEVKKGSKTPMKSEENAVDETLSEAIMSQTDKPMKTVRGIDEIETFDEIKADEGNIAIAENKAIEEERAVEEKKSIEESQTIEQGKTIEAVLKEQDKEMAAIRNTRHSKVGFNLYASNGFGHQTNKNGVLMSQQMLDNYKIDRNLTTAGTRADSPVYLYNYEEKQEHYQPISFGLTANIPISSAFSLSSGVVYTRLRSDFTNVADYLVYQKQMTLHYIGIPLNVQYHAWQWHGLNVYATAGAQVDFNVKVRVVTGGTEVKMEKDSTQWSVGGALGVQYDIIPQLGVYVEPGIKYYFDNGSHVHNYFKYKPTNFNLQVGLRLNIKP